MSGDVAYCDDETVNDISATAGVGGTITWYDDAGLTNVVSNMATHTPASSIGIHSYFATETANGCESPSAEWGPTSSAKYWKSLFANMLIIPLVINETSSDPMNFTQVDKLSILDHFFKDRRKK